MAAAHPPRTSNPLDIMDSSPQFIASSPLSPSTAKHRRQRSRFTFKQLSTLASSQASCPLRVIAHIDLDAFYAQCEMVRLNVPEDVPLAVQQWQGLIAINYPARAFGLNRHVTITDARKACPHIVLQHVATWKEGDEKWAYHEDSFKNMATHKVSLDAYRLQSRRILATIKETLPTPPMQKVEKASIDEVFLDLSAQVHQILLERFPELRGPAPYDDPTEKLPAPPTTALDWNADALIDLDPDQHEDDDPDWDDVAMNVGSEIVRQVRAAVREKLHYTCSAGLARNKMLAKLGSGHKKPNSQTIVRNRAIQKFLSELKFTKIRNLGGKLGEEVQAQFNTELIKDLLPISLDQMKRLGDDTGTWLYQTIRGEDYSEVNSRTQIKSMLSAKSFRPSINTMDQATKWLRIFVADIYSRLVEEGVLENKRRPKTITLHHRQGDQSRAKQAPIPQGRQIEEQCLFQLASDLMAQVVVDGRAWPCGNLSLSVGGFEDGVSGNQGIGGFLVRGEEAKNLQPLNQSRPPSADVFEPHLSRPTKRRRVETRQINNFFSKQPESSKDESESEPTDFDEVPSAQQGVGDGSHLGTTSLAPLPESTVPPSSSPPRVGLSSSATERTETMEPATSEGELFHCGKCDKKMHFELKEEHEDWHFAKELQEEERSVPQQQHNPTVKTTSRGISGPKPGRGRGRPSGTGPKGAEKGQSRLAFGR